MGYLALKIDGENIKVEGNIVAEKHGQLFFLLFEG